MFTVKRTFIFIVLVGLGVGGYFGYRYLQTHQSASLGKDDNVSPDQLFTVKRDDLILGMTLGGKVNSQKKHKLSCEAAFRTKMVSYVDENKKVKKGDVLATFETDELEDKIDQLKLEIDTQNKELLIAKEEREILVSSNAADIRSANDKVTEAQDAYDKYWKLEGPKAKDAQRLKVEEAEKALQDAEKAHQDLREKISETVYKDEKTKETDEHSLETLKQKYQSAEVAYSNAQLDYKLFKRYSHPNKLTSLDNALEQARLNLKKTKIKTSSSLVQKDNQIFKIETQLRKLKNDLEKHEGYVPKMKLVSPVDGIVIYGDPDRRWGKIELKVGMDIHRNQVLLTIPDMSKLIVEFQLPEQFRSRVKKEDKVYITPDSIPNLRLEGTVSYISAVPVHLIRWDSFSPKMYTCKVKLTAQNPRLVSEMNVKIEIITKILKDRITVPIEAVFEEGGDYIVYRKDNGSYEEVKVKIGASNDNFVEIVSGLQENERVYLFRPYQSSQGE